MRLELEVGTIGKMTSSTKPEGREKLSVVSEWRVTSMAERQVKLSQGHHRGSNAFLEAKGGNDEWSEAEQ